MTGRAARAARTATVVSAAVVAITCVVHLPGCSDDGTYVYLGRFYLEGRGCLGTTSSIDVIAGEPPATNCAPICLVQQRAEGGRAVYVSSMCPPYPATDFDRSGQEPVCALALAAFSRGDTCATDGGSSQPDAPDAAAAFTDASDASDAD